MTQKKIKEYWEYHISVLLFIISGGAYFYMLNGIIFVPLYFLSCLYYANRWGKLYKKNYSNFYLYYYLIWSSISFYIIYPSHSESANQFYTISLMLLGTYWFFSNITFKRFKVIYLNVCSLLALISLIIYMLAHLGLAPITIVNLSLFSFFHCLGWDGISDRLFGIYWEPGVYQIVLNVSLFIYLNEIANMSLTKRQKIKLTIIIIALLLTQSTAGYLNLAIIVGLIVFRSKKIRSNIFILTATCFLACLAIYYLYNSPVVQKKLEQQGKEGTSYEIRLADNIGMLIMTSEKPLIGYGLSSTNYDIRAEELGNQTSSNGILAMSAMLGLPFLFVYLYFMSKGVKRIIQGSAANLCLPLIILFHCTEVYFYFPIALIFIINFKKEPTTHNHINIKRNCPSYNILNT